MLQMVAATLDFLPDDPDAAEQLRPWLAYQLDGFLDALTHGDLRITELVGAVGVLGGAFSRVVGDARSQPLPRLRAVGD